MRGGFGLVNSRSLRGDAFAALDGLLQLVPVKDCVYRGFQVGHGLAGCF